MFFNSFTFFIFFLTTSSLYFLLQHRMQNRLLLLASYLFYGAWDYRFLLLILTTTAVDYYTARLIYANHRRNMRSRLLCCSISINLLILGYFKYCNFFIESAIGLLHAIGFEATPISLNIILPVGISFYTFQSMSYTIDVYREKVKPVAHFFDYALYVSFFPQLVAGPIERATHLIPQILHPRTISWEKIQNGLFFIVYGLFLKVFMADNLAFLVDPIFASSESQTGFSFLLAGYGFAFQIFGDFAGYSYIAKGLGAILGFDIMDNFTLPYFSRNPQQFWQRWHISLSTWLRDYLYIPLGGSKSGIANTVRNLFITMFLGGLWHGAKVTFVAWGLFHGFLLALYHYSSRIPMAANEIQDKRVTTFFNAAKTVLFFHIIVLSWYFFRADSFEQLVIIFQKFLFDFQLDVNSHRVLIKKLIFYIAPLLFYQLFQIRTDNILFIFKWPLLLRSIVYLVIFYLIVIFGVTNAQDFIYFQF